MSKEEKIKAARAKVAQINKIHADKIADGPGQEAADALTLSKNIHWNQDVEMSDVRTRPRPVLERG